MRLRYVSVTEVRDMTIAGVKPQAGSLPPATSPSSHYALPPRGLIRSDSLSEPRASADEATVRALSRVFAQFDVDAQVTGYTQGLSATLYEIALGPGVSVDRITSLSRNIAYSVKCPSVRIFSPIPGKSVVGLEVPHGARGSVTLGDVLSSPVAASDKHPLLVGLGKDLWGRMVVANLARMPHLLIAGSTGSGKSATIHSIITSILSRATPGEASMLLIDPRMAELALYEGIPHQLAPVTAGTKAAAEALGRVVDEMERRYDALAAAGFRHVNDLHQTAPNKRLTSQGRHLLTAQQYPFLLVVIDEVARLVGESGHRVEAALTSIARRGRIVGVHLILATDQPSVLGSMPLVRANLPSRLALRTSSTADSRLILDEPGAETLAGQGDALYLPMSASRPVRIQAAFVSEAETRDIVAHCVKQTQPPNPQGTPVKPAANPDPAGKPGHDSHLLVQAAELIVSSQFGSTSMLQRKLGIGFSHADRLMEVLETYEIVGPTEGSKAREVLVRPDDMQRVTSSLTGRIKPDNSESLRRALPVPSRGCWITGGGSATPSARHARLFRLIRSFRVWLS